MIETPPRRARHPMRRALARHDPPRVPAPVLANADDSDWKLFVLSFTAFFICFYTFIV
jgi:hypothetical protein